MRVQEGDVRLLVEVVGTKLAREAEGAAHAVARDEPETVLPLIREFVEHGFLRDGR